MCVYMNCQQICKISPKKTWPKWKSVNCLNELESSDVCDSRLCFWRACLVVQPFSMTDRVLEAAMSGRFLGCLRPRARDRKWCSRSPWAARRPTSTTRCVLVMAKHTSILHTPDAGICWVIWQCSLSLLPPATARHWAWRIPSITEDIFVCVGTAEMAAH